MSRFAVAAGITWLNHEGVVYVAALPDGPIHVLDGVGGTIWRAAVEGELDLAVADFARESAEDIEKVRADLDDFLDELVRRRLLCAV